MKLSTLTYQYMSCLSRSVLSDGLRWMILEDVMFDSKILSLDVIALESGN